MNYVTVDVFVLELGVVCVCFFFQAEDGIRDLVRSRGLGDVYKRQIEEKPQYASGKGKKHRNKTDELGQKQGLWKMYNSCLLYTSDAADERSSVDLGGRRIIKKKKQQEERRASTHHKTSNNTRR